MSMPDKDGTPERFSGYLSVTNAARLNARGVFVPPGVTLWGRKRELSRNAASVSP